MSKEITQKVLRSRGNFKCEACGKSLYCQYAHIIPESDGGEYSVSNMLFLCYEHHLKYEIQGLPANSAKRNLLVKEMYKIRNNRKLDTAWEKFFEYPAEKLIVKIGNNVLINNPVIFRSTAISPGSDYCIDLLSIELNNGYFMINGLFFDQNKKLILSIKDNMLQTDAANLFDLKLYKNGKLELISRDKTMRFILEQDADGALSLSGCVYYFGKRIELSKSRGIISDVFAFDSCKFINNQNWFKISPEFGLMY